MKHYQNKKETSKEEHFKYINQIEIFKGQKNNRNKNKKNNKRVIAK